MLIAFGMVSEIETGSYVARNFGTVAESYGKADGADKRA